MKQEREDFIKHNSSIKYLLILGNEIHYCNSIEEVSSTLNTGNTNQAFSIFEATWLNPNEHLNSLFPKN